MDAHEWYRRQMVELREYEIKSNHRNARMARDARMASVGSHIASTLRSFSHRVPFCRGEHCRHGNRGPGGRARATGSSLTR